MPSKPIYFSLEDDEKRELDETAKQLRIKPSELARRRYRKGLAQDNVPPVIDALLKLSTFQYAALERIMKQKGENHAGALQRGADLYSDATKKLNYSDE